jgi:hypothetical protein
LKAWFTKKLQSMRFASQLSLTYSEIRRASPEENAHVLLYFGTMRKNGDGFFPNANPMFDNPNSFPRDEILKNFYELENARNVMASQFDRLIKSGNAPPQPLLGHIFLGIRFINVALATLSPTLNDGMGKEKAVEMWSVLSKSHQELCKVLPLVRHCFSLAGKEVTMSDEEWICLAIKMPEVYSNVSAVA